MTGIIIMMMVSMFGLAYITFTTNNLTRADRDERRAIAFYLSEAAMDWAISQTIDYVTTTNGTVPSTTYTTAITNLLNGLKPGATGSVTIVANGGSIATFTSTATFRGVTQTLRVKMKFRNIGIWNNAIFAGVGASGRGINGNVDIRGSVHILGDGESFSDLNGNGVRDIAETYTDSNGNGAYDSGEPFNDADHNGVWTSAEPFQDNDFDGVYDPPLTAADITADLSGGANIGNNYNGMPADISARVPPLDFMSYGGESVQSLNSEVRVKHGKLDLSGTATAGQANQTGNTVKETLDGVYCSDGYGGNKGASGINSDNGTTNPYDLGDRLKFPSLADPYRDPATGVQYAHMEDFLDAKSLVITETAIGPTTPSFSHSDGIGNSISWDTVTDTLTINGIVRVDGNLDLSDKASIIYYAGKGTLFSKGSVSVHGSIMPSTRFCVKADGTPGDVMGVIAKMDINFATGSGESQLSGAGAWYAQRKIVSAKQNKFAGTYVSDYFDMGTNVPSIYQVPLLAQNMPPGMPGGEGVWTAQTLSWRHL